LHTVPGPAGSDAGIAQLRFVSFGSVSIQNVKQIQETYGLDILASRLDKPSTHSRGPLMNLDEAFEHLKDAAAAFRQFEVYKSAPLASQQYATFARATQNLRHAQVILNRALQEQKQGLLFPWSDEPRSDHWKPPTGLLANSHTPPSRQD
jgi:hypothetical protein